MRLGIDTTLSKRIAQLAVPVVIGMLTETLVNHVDTILVSRLPGNVGIDGVAAIWLSLPVFWAIGGFFASLQVGTQALVARRFGEGRPEEAGKVLTNSLAVALFAGAAASAAGWFVIPKLFPLLNPNPEVVRLGSQYCQIRMLNIFSMVITFSFKGFFDAIGKTYVHMAASIAMNIVNLCLAVLLVYGFWGFPRLEVAGSAVATLSATYVGLFMMLGWALKGNYRKSFVYFRLGNLNRRVMWEVVRLSFPSGLASIFLMSGFVFFLWVMGHLRSAPALLDPLSFLPLSGPLLRNLDLVRPDLATSASGVMLSILTLVFLTSFAFGTATATLVGQSLGAKKPELAERYGWESAKLGIYVMGTVGLLLIAFPRTFLYIFTNKPDVIEFAVPSLRLMGSVTGLVSAGLVLVQALYGAGNPKFVMKAQMILHFGCLIPLSYLLGVGLGLGMFGTWAAAAVYAILLSSVMAWKFRQGHWKQIQI